MNDWFEAEQRVERAQQLSESQRFAEALAEIDVALSINPNNAAWHAQRGYLLDELGQVAEAVSAFERSLLMESGERDVSMALGVALLQLERYARAIEVFEELSRLYPDFEPAYCYRINAYAHLGQHDRAEEMFYLAQELNAECPHCFFHIGASLADRGQTERAIYCWQRVLELEPAYIGVNRRIAQAYCAQGKLDLAREYFLEEFREDPGNTDLICEFAELLLAAGDVATAAAKYLQVLELEPDHAAAQFALGRVWLQTGQSAQALTCFDALRTDELDDKELAELERCRGEALLQLGRVAEAREPLTKAAGRAGADAHTHMLLGTCLMADNHPAEAADSFRLALAQDSRNCYAHNNLGICSLRTGLTETGLLHFLEAIRLKPDFKIALFHAGVAHVELGRWRDAKSMLERTLKVDPEFVAARQLRDRLWRFRLRHTARRIRNLLLRPLFQ